MQFTRLELTGFGCFAEQTVIDFRPNSLGVILGRNEAGKSTLLAAIFAGIFGLKPAEKKQWRSWEGEGDYRVKLNFSHHGREYLLERDLNKNFVRLVMQGQPETILFNDYHLPSEKFDRIYFEAFRQIAGLPSRANLMATSVVYEHQLHVDVDANLRQIITGTREADYEDVLAALEEEYYRISRERLPWQRYGGPRSDQLLEKKKSQLLELEGRLENAMRYFSGQRQNQQNLMEAEADKKRIDSKIPSLQKLLSVLQKYRMLQDELNKNAERKESVLKQLSRVEALEQKKEHLEFEIEQKFANLTGFQPAVLEKEISAYLPSRKRKWQLENRIKDLRAEKDEAAEELRRLPDFSAAPGNYLQLIEEIEGIEKKLPAQQEAEKRLSENTAVFRKKYRSRILLNLLLLLAAVAGGTISFILYPLSFIAWGITALFGFASLIVLFAELVPVRREYKYLDQELMHQSVVINDMTGHKNENFNKIRSYVTADLIDARREYLKYQEICRFREKKEILIQSLESELKTLEEDVQFKEYSSRYEKLFDNEQHSLVERISDYRMAMDKLNNYKQQLSALPALTLLQEEKENFIQQISGLDYQKKMLVEKVPNVKKLLEQDDTDSVFRRVENEIQAAFRKKNELESRISAYQVKLNQNSADNYNPEKLREEREALMEETEYLESRKQALILALETLRTSVQEFRNTYFEIIHTGIRDHLEKVLNPLHYSITLDSDFHLKANYKGIPIKINQLSSGTQDQLFFAYRLVLGKLLAPVIHFPFLIDDAFVHFDPVRAERVFKVLHELKKDYQILVCSSNPDYSKMGDYTIDLSGN